MNRREFCGMMAAASAAGRLAVVQTPVEQGRPSSHPAVTRLCEMENEQLGFTWFSDASARIVDRRNGAEWRMGPVAFQEEGPIDEGVVWTRTTRSICEQFPGRFAGRAIDGGVEFTVLDQLRNRRGSFRARATLDGPWLDIRLTQIDPRLPSLVFPPPIESESLVVPQGIGRWIRKPQSERSFLPFFSHLNMRWFGGIAGDRCWMALLPEENFVDGGAMLAEMAIGPVWLTSVDEWTPRRVRYRFDKGGYQRLAKLYREWAIENKLHRPLTEKLQAAPALGNLARGRMISVMEAMPRHAAAYDEDVLQPAGHDPLLGSGPKVAFTHAQTRQLMEQLRQAGLERALVNVRGWINGGYDYSHPDPFPPEPALGTTEELRALCATADPFTVVLHDNYQDIYDHSPSFPRGVIRRDGGRLMRGGYWAGGQAYILGAEEGLRYAQRNWPQLSELSPRAMYIDTVSAVQLYQWRDAANRMTRTDDMNAKRRLLSFFKSHGLAIGSEEGADFAVPYADWFENRHRRVEGETVPLWPLVFHDAVLCGRYTGSENSDGGAARQAYPSWLLDMLWGYYLISGVEDAGQAQCVVENVRATQHVDRWLARVATAEMTDHFFASKDESLETTVFSTGDAITVNFSGEPLSHDGRTIPPHGYATFRS